MLLRILSKISKPISGKCFSIRGEIPSSPDEEEVRDEIAFFSSHIQKGLNKKLLPTSVKLLLFKLKSFISVNEGTYGGVILSQKDENQSSFW